MPGNAKLRKENVMGEFIAEVLFEVITSMIWPD